MHLFAVRVGLRSSVVGVQVSRVSSWLIFPFVSASICSQMLYYSPQCSHFGAPPDQSMRTSSAHAWEKY